MCSHDFCVFWSPGVGPLDVALLGLGIKEDVVVAMDTCGIVTGIPVPTPGLSLMRLPCIYTDLLHRDVPVFLLALLFLSD